MEPRGRNRWQTAARGAERLPHLKLGRYRRYQHTAITPGSRANKPARKPRFQPQNRRICIQASVRACDVANRNPLGTPISPL